METCPARSKTQANLKALHQEEKAPLLAREKVHLDLGHVDIFRGLLANADLSQELESELFELLQRKATRELGQWVSRNITDPKLAEWLTILPSLTGSAEILKAAKHKLAGAPAKVLQAIAQQPDAANTITRTLFVSLAMIESTAIYCFVVSMILIFANPFTDLVTQGGGG